MCISISKSVKVTSIHNSDCSSPHYYSFMPPGDPAEGRNTYNDPQAKEKRLLSISFASFYGWPRMAFLCPEPSLSGAINLTFIGAGTFIIKHYSKAHYCMRTSFFLFPPLSHSLRISKHRRSRWLRASSLLRTSEIWLQMTFAWSRTRNGRT